jgi:hypothetical protein
MSSENQRNKARAAGYLAACDEAPLDGLVQATSRYLSPDVIWQGFTPLTDATGPEALVSHYLAPLRRAFPKLERITHILIGGRSDGRVKGGDDGRAWVGAMGYLYGEQIEPTWGIPARPGTRRLRWSEFMEFDPEGRIIRIQMLIDVLDWLEQMDLSPLPKPKGVPSARAHRPDRFGTTNSARPPGPRTRLHSSSNAAGCPDVSSPCITTSLSTNPVEIGQCVSSHRTDTFSIPAGQGITPCWPGISPTMRRASAR